MAGLKEIRNRLKSVRNTKKITYAMKLVSAAKLRKAQEAVTKSREYTNALNKLLNELSSEQGCVKQGMGDAQHRLMEVRSEVKHIRLVVIGGSRGLCGGYNTNVQKKIEEFMAEKSRTNPNAKISSVLIGKRPADYYRRKRREYLSSFEELPEDPNRWPLAQVCQDLEQDFLAGEVDEVYLLSTKFRSAISVSPQIEKLLPMTAEIGSNRETAEAAGTTLFEPSAVEVFSAIIPRIMRAKVRQAALDAKASEHGSRMTAMDSATRNANDLINSLQLKHNKLRQAGITAQLLDIVGGAEALK